MNSKLRIRINETLEEMGDTPDLKRMAELLESLGAEDEPADPKERKRLRILQVAIDSFVRHGYRRTSIDDVAARAHVAKGTVYLYFKNKADLLVEAITHEKVRYARRLQPLLAADMSAIAKLKLYLWMALKMVAELPLLARLLSGDDELLAVLHDVDEVLGVRTTEMQLTFLASLVDGATSPSSWTPDEVRERASVLLSLVSLASGLGDDGSRFGLSLDRYAELLADILVEGIGAEAAHSANGGSGFGPAESESGGDR